MSKKQNKGVKSTAMNNLSNERYYLGIDAGGTQTLALLIASDGHVAGWGSGGPANHVTVGIAQAKEAISQAVDAALQNVPTIPVAVALGSAGLEQTGSLDEALSLLPVCLHHARIVFDTDGMMALEGALGGKPGVVVAAGTGSIAMGRDAMGNMTYAGGWGWRAGDEGSAYWLGQQALMLVFRSADGRAPTTALTQALLTATGCADCIALRDWLYAPERTTSDIAHLSPYVDQVAQRGDMEATLLLTQGAQELATAALAVVRRLALPSHSLVSMTGGVFRSHQIRERFQVELEQAGQLQLQLPILPPSGGAALHAWRVGQQAESIWQIDIPRSAVENLRSSLPAADCFGK
jgi:N-acetylglucosamine kinase-like BadF-type ATPase